MNRRRFLQTFTASALLAPSAQAGLRRVPDCESGIPRVISGFRAERGLIVFFDFNLGNPDRHQYGLSSPYFFPQQYDVNKASEGFKLNSTGFSSKYLRGEGKSFRGNFNVDGFPEFDFQGHLPGDGSENELELLCPKKNDPIRRNEYNDPNEDDINREKTQALTEEEIFILNERICRGEVKIFNDVYPMPDRFMRTSPCHQHNVPSV